jgi:hypothetical protein
MQLQQKNNLGGCNPRLFLLPILGTLFLRKPASGKPSEESTLDFHLAIVKKIDELLQDHDNEPSVNASVPAEKFQVTPRSTPVELRQQLGKRVDHVEVDLPHLQMPSLTKNRVIPEEFKVDQTLGVEPEFKFITSLDSLEHALRITPHQQPRIEVIDLGDFTTDDVSSHLTRPIIIDAQPAKQKTKQQSTTKETPQTKKIEVIDVPAFIQHTSEDVFLTALKQNEQIEKKSQIYYLKAVGRKDEKTKKKDVEQSYVPDDFEQRLKLLREKQQQEEEQKREQEEKLRKQREKEEQEKRELEEKERKQLEKEQEKLAKDEAKKTKTEEKKPSLEKEQQKEASGEVVTKKQLKEQQRLERIAARKAKIQERLKIKKEKKLLKEQQKHLTFATSAKKGKYTAASTELDSDVKKILQITDALLGELPEEIINRFMQSDDFELYEHILNKYKIR